MNVGLAPYEDARNVFDVRFYVAAPFGLYVSALSAILFFVVIYNTLTNNNKTDMKILSLIKNLNRFWRVLKYTKN